MMKLRGHEEKNMLSSTNHVIPCSFRLVRKHSIELLVEVLNDKNVLLPSPFTSVRLFPTFIVPSDSGNEKLRFY